MCLAAVGIVASLVGGIVSGIGAMQAAQAQQAQYDAQAQMQERQAEIERRTSLFEQSRADDKAERVFGMQRAGFIANGLSLQGSAFDVAYDTGREHTFDQLAIRWNSKLKQDNYHYSAAVSRMNADAAGQAAGPAFLAPVLGAAGGAFKGFAQLNSRF